MPNTETPLSEDLVIYQTPSGSIELREDVNSETIWATQAQIAQLFEVNVRTINEHLINIFSSQELTEDRTIRNFRIVRLEGKRQVTRNIEHYNLDVIIAVGYRVNSKKATAFRRWATKILREHLTKGYTINESRLAQLEHGMQDAHRAIELAKTAIGIQMEENNVNNADLTAEVLNILERYTRTFTLLESFDEKTIVGPKGVPATHKITYEECQEIVATMKDDLMSREEASKLFGHEREHGLDQVIGAIYQTFSGDDLYPTIEDKAAHVLYLIIKDHPFNDGNKRIGSFLFVYFLNKSGYLYRADGENKINDNALVVLALLVAESNPKDKELLINLIKQLVTA